MSRLMSTSGWNLFMYIEKRNSIPSGCVSLTRGEKKEFFIVVIV